MSNAEFIKQWRDSMVIRWDSIAEWDTYPTTTNRNCQALEPGIIVINCDLLKACEIIENK